MINTVWEKINHLKISHCYEYYRRFFSVEFACRENISTCAHHVTSGVKEQKNWWWMKRPWMNIQTKFRDQLWVKNSYTTQLRSVRIAVIIIFFFLMSSWGIKKNHRWFIIIDILYPHVYLRAKLLSKLFIFH